VTDPAGGDPRAALLASIQQAAAHGDWPTARQGLEALLPLAPGQALLWSWYGWALEATGAPVPALDAYDRALELDPDQPDTLANRADLRRRLVNAFVKAATTADERGDGAEAEANFRNVLVIDPDHAAAALALAKVLDQQWRPAEALEFAARAVALAPESPEARYQLALLQQRAGNRRDARANFAATLALAPDHAGARLEYWRCCQALADWPALPAAEADVRELVAAGTALPVFPLLMLDLPGAELLAAARRWQAQWPLAPATPQSPRPERIRLAYLSSDLLDHPVGHLIVEVLERHDRARFHITAAHTGPITDDPLQQRLRRAADHWLPLTGVDDSTAAQHLRAAKIDILIDLNGLTRGARPGLLAQRPAPRIGCWAGYPGTTGAPAVDFALVDTAVAPFGCEAAWSEQLIRLPGCYLPLDTTRPVPAAPDRSRWNLPADALVLASFNQAWKITPAVLDLWCQALAALPAACLWLLNPGADTANNWRTQLKDRGVDPDRLILAPRLANADHLARLPAADLALDPWPYGSHTTGADALAAGVPLLSWTGTSMPARVGTSLLQAVGLPDLASATPADHLAQIIALSQDPDRRAALRRHLLAWRAQKRGLFDMAGLVRAVEMAVVSTCIRG